MLVTLDTNVLYQALRGRDGASYAILQLVGQGYVQLTLSVPLFLEYEAVLKRPSSLRAFQLDFSDIDQVLAFLLRVGQLFEIFFRLRPNLRDEADNMLVEVAITSHSDYLITNNVKDFLVAAELHFQDLQVVTPEQFMQIWRTK